MPKSTKKRINTTIQVKIDLAHIIKDFCLARGLTISGTTELLWKTHISGSTSTYKHPYE